VAEEVLLVAVVVPHGLAALHAIRELDFDGWDLSVRIQLVEPLRDVGDRRPEAAIATFYLVALEAFRDLLGESHLFFFVKRDVTINKLLKELLGGLLRSCRI
jgi:hypothetical protein